MDTDSANSDTRHRSKLFQFGVRGLILLTAILPLGLWLWWQHPFEIEVVNKTYPDPFSASSVDQKEVRTMKRTGWKKTVQHGPTILYGIDGRKISEEHWRYDRRHGPDKKWNYRGQLIASGQFSRGEEKREVDNLGRQRQHPGTTAV